MSLDAVLLATAVLSTLVIQVAQQPPALNVLHLDGVKADM